VSLKFKHDIELSVKALKSSKEFNWTTATALQLHNNNCNCKYCTADLIMNSRVVGSKLPKCLILSVMF